MSEDVGWFIFFECDVSSERAHLSTTHTLSECCLGSHTTPGQPGTGQKCSYVGVACPHMNICAPKPHQRWVPRLYPVPYCPNAFLFRYNVKHERACLNTLHTRSKTEKYPSFPRALLFGEEGIYFRLRAWDLSVNIIFGHNLHFSRRHLCNILTKLK